MKESTMMHGSASSGYSPVLRSNNNSRMLQTRNNNSICNKQSSDKAILIGQQKAMQLQAKLEILR